MKCVVESSPGGHNNAVSGENITWYEWDSYLKQYYKPLTGITQFHHFIIDKSGVKTKQFADSESSEPFYLLLQPITSEMPNVISRSGLSLDRQWYIYNNLRSLVSNANKADILAPLPARKLTKEEKKEKEVEKSSKKKNKKNEKVSEEMQKIEKKVEEKLIKKRKKTEKKIEEGPVKKQKKIEKDTLAQKVVKEPSKKQMNKKNSVKKPSPGCKKV